MQAQLTGKNKKGLVLCLSKGFSTLEILIAFAVLILCITAVILVVFGNQSVAVDTQTNIEAISKAQALLEKARADSREDFESVEDCDDGGVTPCSGVADPLYNRKLTIDPASVTQCGEDIISSTNWTVEGRTMTVDFITHLGDIVTALALGGDCAFTPPGLDDWKKPIDLSYGGIDLKTEGKGKAIDAQNNIAYLVTKAAGNNKDDFYIFDVSDIDNPVKHGVLDISDGLEDIDVAGDYAFIANDENKNTEQLVVVDISDLDAPNKFTPVSLPGVSGTCPATCPGGRSIFYFNERAYLGTHRLVAGGAAEFHVFDVTTPSSPSWLGSKGGVALGDPVDHNLNDIFVKTQAVGGTTRTYAYLATSNDIGELTVLNVTNPGSIPNPAGTPATGSILNLPGSNAANERLDGTSLFVLGDRAYVGRERATNAMSRDFFVINISNPGTPSILGSMNLGLNSSGSSVVGIHVAANLAFVATSDPNKPFVVLNISDPAAITRWDVVACGIDFSTYPTDLDYDNNLIYLPLFNASSNVNLKIIKAIGGSC